MWMGLVVVLVLREAGRVGVGGWLATKLLNSAVALKKAVFGAVISTSVVVMHCFFSLMTSSDPYVTGRSWTVVVHPSSVFVDVEFASSFALALQLAQIVPVLPARVASHRRVWLVKPPMMFTRMYDDVIFRSPSGVTWS